jgi:hypothetical protein
MILTPFYLYITHHDAKYKTENNTSNVHMTSTLRRVCATTVTMEKLTVLHISMCLLLPSVPSMQITPILHCIIHHLWPSAVPPFSTLSQKGTILARRLSNIKCVYWFYLQILFEIFLILSRIQRDININVHKSSCKVPVILIRHQISWKFSGSRVVPCGQMEKDRQDEANSHFVQFFKCTYCCH